MTRIDSRRQFPRFIFRITSLFWGALAASPAAAAMLGEGIINWTRNNIVLPVGVFSIIVAIGASIFRPDLVKGALYTALITAVLFFVMSGASGLATALGG